MSNKITDLRERIARGRFISKAEERRARRQLAYIDAIRDACKYNLDPEAGCLPASDSASEDDHE